MTKQLLEKIDAATMENDMDELENLLADQCVEHDYNFDAICLIHDAIDCLSATIEFRNEVRLAKLS